MLSPVHSNSNKRTERTVLTSAQAHLVSTRGVSLARMRHLHTPEQAESQFQDQQNTAAMLTPVTELSGTPENELSRSYISSAEEDDKEIFSDNENSIAIESYYSPENVTKSRASMTWRQNVNNDSVLLTPNTITSTTPELPVCGSADSLDIPFASFFDLMDVRDSVVNTPSAKEVFRGNIRCSSKTTSLQRSGGSDLPNITGLHLSMTHLSTPCTDSPVRYSRFRLTTSAHTQAKTGTYGSDEVPQSRVMLHEPTVVRQTPKPLARSLTDLSDTSDENNNSDLRTTGFDFEIESESGDDSHDRSLQENSEDDIQHVTEGSSMFMTDREVNKLAVQPLSSGGTNRMLSSLSSGGTNRMLSLLSPTGTNRNLSSWSATSSSSTTESSFLCSEYADALQKTDNREEEMQSKSPTTDKVINTARLPDIASDSVPWSECKLSDELQHIATDQSVSKTGLHLSCRDVSWSYHVLPDASLNRITSHRGRDSMSNDRYITVRAKLLPRASVELDDDETGSAAKRRKGIDGTAVTRISTADQARSVKQRLPFTSPLKSTLVDHHTTESHHHTTDSHLHTTESVVSDTSHTPSSARPTPYTMCSGIQRKPLADQGSQRKPLEDQGIQRKPLADQGIQRKPLADQGIQRKPLVDQGIQRKPLGDQNIQRKPLADQGFQRKLLADQGIQRKLLAGLGNVRHGHYNMPAESSSCLSISSDKDSEMCETSQDTFLSSHKEYKLSRGAYYCDFNEARKHRNNIIIRKVQVSNSYVDHEGNYVLRNPATNEILKRKVEGAENVAPSLVFPTKRQTGTLYRGGAHATRQSFQHKGYNKKVSRQTKDRICGSKRKMAISDRSSNLRSGCRQFTCQDPQQPSEQFRKGSSDYQRSQCTTKPLCSKESTSAPTHKSCRTHPAACSTLITDYSSSDLENDVESIATWALGEESSFCNFQESNLCSTRINSWHKTNNGKKLHAVQVSLGTDASRSSLESEPKRKTFEISSMVSQIDKAMSHARFISSKEMGKMRNDNTSSTAKRSKLIKVTKDHHFSAAPSLSESMNTSSSSGTLQFMNTQEKTSSSSTSEQTTISSMFTNQATASMTCTSSEENTIPEPSHWSYECRNSGLTSAEDSVMHCQNYSDSDDLGTTPTSEEQQDIYNKYNTPDDTLCSAARCRPRHSNQQLNKHLLSERSSQSSQNALSSVLTDSPESVNPSGILAPDNSSSNIYSEYAYFYNRYSNANNNHYSNLNNIYPGVPRNYIMVNPKVSGPATYHMSSTDEKNSADFVAERQLKATSNTGQCYYPHTSVPDTNPTITPQLKHQSQHTSSSESTSCQSTSVSKDHLINKSLFAVPSCVVTGPSKIKKKNSLGHKLRKFRNNVYRKTKKITHLHIC